MLGRTTGGEGGGRDIPSWLRIWGGEVSERLSGMQWSLGAGEQQFPSTGVFRAVKRSGGRRVWVELFLKGVMLSSRFIAKGRGGEDGDGV